MCRVRDASKSSKKELNKIKASHLGLKACKGSSEELFEVTASLLLESKTNTHMDT